jgi:hypothetical protein
VKAIHLSPIIVAVASVFGTPSTEESILLRGPGEATSQDLERTAQAVLVRCRGYGYRGIRASIVDNHGERVIRLASDSGFTPVMRSVLHRLAGTSGRSAQIRFPYEMTGEECEKYYWTEHPSERRFPPEARWYSWEAAGMGAMLLRNRPVILRLDLVISRSRNHQGVDEWSFVLSTSKARELRSAIARLSVRYPVLLFDDRLIEPVHLCFTMMDPREGTLLPSERAVVEPRSRWVSEVLATPLPFALEEVPEAR